MSGAAAGSNATAKLQEDKKAEIDPAKTSQQPSQPNTLEEDDEFEDFPVEGELQPRIIRGHFVQMRAMLTYRALSRLDTGGSRSTRRQHTSVGGELG
jgi:hypothetical protein